MQACQRRELCGKISNMLVSILENSSEVNNSTLLLYNLIESNVILKFPWYNPKQKKAENIW